MSPCRKGLRRLAEKRPEIARSKRFPYKTDGLPRNVRMRTTPPPVKPGVSLYRVPRFYRGFICIASAGLLRVGEFGACVSFLSGPAMWIIGRVATLGRGGFQRIFFLTKKSNFGIMSSTGEGLPLGGACPVFFARGLNLRKG